ncbi:MAG: hypothetical protein R3B13_20510 [Polyangiaceae bacterium]
MGEVAGSWFNGEYLLKQLPTVGVSGLPFVVMANGKRAYVGAFAFALTAVGLRHRVRADRPW